MPIQTQQPAAPQQNPFAPLTFDPLVMEEFSSINTATTRPGVPDSMCYWIDGFIPLAPRHLRTLYGIGSAIYTASGGKTVVLFGFYNIGATPYMIVFLSDGSVVQVNTSTLATTIVLPAATISSPAINNVGFTQWGSQYLIIVANQTNGYWIWDGILLYDAGTLAPGVSLTNVGSGYATAPTVVASGGNGGGASFVAAISGGIVTGVTMLNPGSGYLATNSNITLTFTGGLAAGTGAAVTVGVSGLKVTSAGVTAGGAGYSRGVRATVQVDGVGDRAQLALTVGAPPGPITAVSVVYGGTKYTFIPTVSISDPTISAAGTLTLMPFAIQGTAVETYTQRVWVANVASITYSAPGSVSNFATSAGGGSFTSNDSYLKVGYTQLLQSNGFLYLIGDSSVDYISGVQTSGSPPTTTFTKQNADPEVGSPFPYSVETFGRDIMLSNSSGVYVGYGAALAKISEALDGVWNTVSNFGNLSLSASKALIFGKKVWITLVRIIDPVSGSTVNKLAMTRDGKKWFVSEQDVVLTYIKHQEINSIITAYGTDGTHVYSLFSTASSAFTKTVQSKLWDTPSGVQHVKATSRFWAETQYYSTVSGNVTLNVDGARANASDSASYTLTGPASTGYNIVGPQAVGQQGVFTGMTLKTNAADMAVILAMLESDIVGYRG